MSSVLTGCRLKFSLDGVKIGYATGVTIREQIQYEAVKVLDDIQVKEHVPVAYDVSMSADTIRLVLSDTFKSRGNFPEQGVNSSEFLSNILTNGELVADVEDTQTNQIVAHVEGVKISERNVSIASIGIVGENVSMVAKRLRNEADLLP